MANIELVIDGAPVIDGELADWQQPDMDKLGLLNTSGIRQPGRPACAMALAEAIATRLPTRITLDTSDSGWTLRVFTPRLVDCSLGNPDARRA